MDSGNRKTQRQAKEEKGKRELALERKKRWKATFSVALVPSDLETGKLKDRFPTENVVNAMVPMLPTTAQK